jgi:hypothetical protein
MTTAATSNRETTPHVRPAAPHISAADPTYGGQTFGSRLVSRGHPFHLPCCDGVRRDGRGEMVAVVEPQENDDEEHEQIPGRVAATDVAAAQDPLGVGEGLRVQGGGPAYLAPVEGAAAEGGRWIAVVKCMFNGVEAARWSGSFDNPYEAASTGEE